jgi:membrane protease subunit HflK
MDRKTKAVIISIAANSFLALLKYILSLLTGSLALLADAYHSTSDIVVSILVLIGIRVSAREKISSVLKINIENGIAIIISFFIFFAAYTIFNEALTKSIEAMRFLPFAIIGTLVCIVICYLLSAYKINVGEATHSPSMIADGHHSRTDMYSSIVVLVALVGHMIGLRLDTPAALLIALLIVSIGIDLFWSSLKTIFSNTPFTYLPFTFRRFPIFESVKQGLFNALSKYQKRVIRVGLLLVVIVYITTGFYFVQPNEDAIVYRFGHMVREKIHPGLHYAIPFPFERVTIVATREIHRTEIGFRTRKQILEEPDAYLWQVAQEVGKYEKRYDEALMITGDMNVLEVDLVIQFQINDLKEYLHTSQTPDDLLKNMGESAVRNIMASENIENLLTEKRTDTERKIQTTLEGYLEKYALGIKVLNVSIHNIHPPSDVVPIFRSVINAKEDLERFIHEAEAEYSEKVIEAEETAIQMRKEANAYSTERTNHASGEGQRFVHQSNAMRYSRSVNETRIYLEAVEDILKDRDKYIITSPTQGSVLDLRSVFNQNIE